MTGFNYEKPYSLKKNNLIIFRMIFLSMFFSVSIVNEKISFGEEKDTQK